MFGYSGAPRLGSASLLLVLAGVSNAGATATHKNQAHKASSRHTISQGRIHRSLQTCTVEDGLTVRSEAFPLMEGCFEGKYAIPSGDTGSDVMYYYASDAAQFQTVFDLNSGYRWYADYFEGGVVGSIDELVTACRTTENIELDVQPADESLAYECDLDGDGVFETSPVTDDIFSVTCGCDDADTSSPLPSPTPSGPGAGTTTPGPVATGAPSPEATDSGWRFTMAPTTDYTAAPTSGSHGYHPDLPITASPTGFIVPPTAVEYPATPSPVDAGVKTPRGVTSTTAPEGDAPEGGGGSRSSTTTPSPVDTGLTSPRGSTSTVAPAGSTGPPAASGPDDRSTLTVAPTTIFTETDAPTATPTAAPTTRARGLGTRAPLTSSDSFTTSTNASSKAFACASTTLLTIVVSSILAMFATVRG